MADSLSNATADLLDEPIPVPNYVIAELLQLAFEGATAVDEDSDNGASDRTSLEFAIFEYVAVVFRNTESGIDVHTAEVCLTQRRAISVYPMPMLYPITWQMRRSAPS